MYKIIKIALLQATVLSLVGCGSVPGMPLFNTHSVNPKINEAGSFKLIKLSFKNIGYFTRPDERYLSVKERAAIALKMKTYPKVTGYARGVGGYGYLIGSQDVLSITVWGEPDVTTSANGPESRSISGYTVNKSGYFFFPYIGRVRAKGRTAEQIRKELARRLAKYLKEPQVGVTISGFNSQRVTISGQVLQAKVFPINNSPLRIRDVIAGAGGLKPIVVKQNGDNYNSSRQYGKEGRSVSHSVSSSNGYTRTELPKRALLTRANGTKLMVDLVELFSKGNESHNYILRGGDALHVFIPEQIPQHLGLKLNHPERLRKVFMMGELKTTGTIIMDPEGLTLAEALSDRGGINEKTANSRGVFIIRNTNNKRGIPQVYQLTLQSVHSMILAEKFALHDRDIVYVTAAPVSRWSRVITQILPFLSTASSVGNLTR